MWLGDKMGEDDIGVLLNMAPVKAIQWMAFYDEKVDRERKAQEAAKERAKQNR